MDLENYVFICGYSYVDFLRGSINIGEKVTQMGSNILSGCTALTNIEVNSNIGKSSFKNCTTLESLVLGTSVKIIGEQAFTGCTTIREIILPEGVEEIGEQAFFGCTSLSEITLPKTLKKISSEVFYETRMLHDIFYQHFLGNSQQY